MTYKIIGVGVEYLIKNNSPILAFELVNKKRFGSDEIIIRYSPFNGDWYGEKICDIGEVELEKDEIDVIKDFLFEYKCYNKPFYTNKCIFDYLDYCYNNDIYNYGFNFIVIERGKYIPIDCIDNDYYCEKFDTIYEYFKWLYGND